ASLGPAQVAFLYLYGSWEESRGGLADRWGTAEGPVRLLAVPMRDLLPGPRGTLMLRFLEQESAFLDQGGTLDADHHAKLAEAWGLACGLLPTTAKLDVRAAAPAPVKSDLAACP